MSVYESTVQGNCEVSETTDVWEDHFPKYDTHGDLTGAKYIRCRNCDREVLEDIDREHGSHRDGCRFEDN